MRFFGQQSRRKPSSAVRTASAARAEHSARSSWALLFLFTAALLASPSFAQTAPYVLPYTMSTYAGPHAAYTAGSPCATNSNFVALDAQGDGCPAASVSVGADPHDIRVDGRGNVYWIDNASVGIIHKISPNTTQQTAFVGSPTNANPCATSVDGTFKYGDGCPANDGAANNNPAVLTTSSKFKTQRGLAIAANGDLYSAGYNDHEIHRVSAATGYLQLVAGIGTSGTSVTAAPIATSALNAPRGVGVDAAGNVYIADTANNILREVTGGQVIPLTAANPNGTKSVTSSVAASSALLSAPEDVQIDSFGNIYIADAGNNVVRAIYQGRGTLPGISNPVTGYIYTIAGGVVLATGATNTTYPADGTTPTVPALNVALTDRKIALDFANNLYIADSSNNVVWFVDATTGYIRTIAGRFGQTASTTPTFVCNPGNGSVGDGCPGSSASLYSNSDMGIDPDNQGNVYITDAQGASNAGGSRLRKLLSGLNFPAAATGASLTQTVQVHLAVGDKFSAATVSPSDFSAAAPACTTQADGTTDCLFPITFKPTVAGYATTTFTVTTTAGASASFVLTGTGSGPSLAIDPGYVTAFNTTVKAPQGITADINGNVYIVDTGNNRVLRYTAGSSTAAAFAGTGAAGYTGDGGLATAATLNAPASIAADTNGNVYITDTGNNVVRRITSAGIISTYAGGSGSCDLTTAPCLATSVSLSKPTGITTDNVGQVYVSDSGNNLIRQISATGYITNLAGGGGALCENHKDNFNDGCAGLQGIFSSPASLAFDPVGNYIVVADTGNNIVRKILLANGIAISNTSVGSATINPLMLVAGNGQVGTSISTSGAATDSQLNAPRGVAVDAAEDVLIADTGNSAIRFVNNSTGVITTVAGVLGTSGAGTAPGSATNLALASPAAVALTAANNLYIADTGNNRVLLDNRSQVTYNFGRVNQGTTSPTVPFTETNTGSSPESFPSPFTVMTGSADFTLIPPSNSVCVGNGVLAIGASCILNGSFSPSAIGSESATFSEARALPTGPAPSVTLVGIGATLTKTTSTLAQTSPATGNPQFGGSFTLTATVTAQTCNTTGAPACYPTGTVTFTVDGNTAGAPVPLSTPGSTTATADTASQIISGLGTGTHTAACFYSGDDFYGASSCGNLTITVAQASTTSKLTAAVSGAPQYPGFNCITYTTGTAPSPSLVGDTLCTGETLTAVVTSNTSGTPTGSVVFTATGGTLTSPLSLGTALISNGGQATLAATYLLDANRNLLTDGTLPPGTYTLGCSYTGAANYAASACAGISFTVVAQTTDFALVTRGCQLSSLFIPGTSTAGQGQSCSGAAELLTGNVPTVATADGSTTDASVFIDANNTLSGPVSISCSGLPAYSICTFSPSVLSLNTTSSYASPVGIDVTLWTDIRPGNATSALRKPDLGPAHDETHGALLAMLLGWPVTLFGLAVVLRSRKRGARVLPWLAVLLIMVGSVTAMTGCGLGGPGVDKVVLTPAGTYPITITVKIGSVTHSTVVNFRVTSPGIAGQQ